MFIGIGIAFGQRGIGTASGAALTAPTLTRTSGVSTYPPTVSFTRPIDWADTPTMYGVMQWSTNPTFATFTETASPQVITAAVTTYNFGLSAIVSGTYYMRLGAWTGTRGSLNWSNIVGVGDAVAPTISSSAAPSGYQFVAGTLQLTANKGGYASIVGGANQAEFSISATNLLSWPAETTSGTFAVEIIWTSYSGIASAIQSITLTVAANTASAFSFTDITGATRSTLYTSNTITVAGITGGAALPVTITGGNYSKNGGAYTSAATTAVNGDTFSVQQTSSASYLTAFNIVLTIGATSDTYTVTTLADPADVAWAAETPPAVQNIAFASTTATFNSINFNVGTGIVKVASNFRRCTGVTVGGSACTLVVESNASDTDPNVSIWRIAIASGGSKTVVVTAATAWGKVAISTGTLTNLASGVPSATAVQAGASGADPTTVAITTPANGIWLAAVAGHTLAGTTWSTGTEDADFNDAVDFSHSSAFGRSGANPTYTGHSFSSDACAVGAWSP